MDGGYESVDECLYMLVYDEAYLKFYKKMKKIKLKKLN